MTGGGAWRWLRDDTTARWASLITEPKRPGPRRWVGLFPKGPLVMP